MQDAMLSDSTGGPDRAGLAATVETLLGQLGQDVNRPGLARTPQRVASALQFLTGGSALKLEDVVGSALYDEPVDEMVLVKDIELYSLCEHHMLPFIGRVHVAYLPRDRVIGLSKIPRVVDMFARRLQLQERLTQQIANALEQVLQPRGVGVVVEASHLCMMMRGVQKQNSRALTSCMLGRFRSDEKTRAEFLQLIRPT